MLANIRAVLFDAVGTLITPHPAAAEAYFQFGRRCGSRLSSRAVAERFRAALRSHGSSGGLAASKPAGGADAERREAACELPTCEADERVRWQRVVADVFSDLEDRDELFEQLWRHFAEPSSWRLFSDVEPTLKQLEKRGFQLGIASNFDERLTGIWRRRPLLQICDALFCSSEIGYAKPSRAFYSEIVRRLDLPAEQILMVGDDPVNDVLGARDAGLQALLLDRRGGGAAAEWTMPEGSGPAGNAPAGNAPAGNAPNGSEPDGVLTTLRQLSDLIADRRR